MMDRRTPFYDKQKELNAKFTSFGGWELPVSYSDIIAEHHKVRISAGLFDVSHMGEILVTGEKAEDFVDYLVTNNIKAAENGQAVYSPMCQEDGGTVDDIIVYKFNPAKLLLVVNASNATKVFYWILDHAWDNITILDLSDVYIQLALQGPHSEAIMQKLLEKDIVLPRFFRFIETKLDGMPVILSRTGYTGEDGFEIYMNITDEGAEPVRLWDTLLEKGKEWGLAPIGLGARDTLRLEAALPLYGHELSESISPLEAGLNRFVKLDKESFIGKEALLCQQETGLKKYLVGFKMQERGIPRNGYAVFQKGEGLGYVTSGSLCPTLNQYLGLALVDKAFICEEPLEIEIRERKVMAGVTKLPFYKKQYKK